MEWSIKDKEGWCLKVIHTLGYKIDAKTLEMILNAYDFTQKKKGSVTLMDISELNFSVNGLFGLNEKGEPIV